jgi:hypothetical protein
MLAAGAIGETGFAVIPAIIPATGSSVAEGIGETLSAGDGSSSARVIAVAIVDAVMANSGLSTSGPAAGEMILETMVAGDIFFAQGSWQIEAGEMPLWLILPDVQGGWTEILILPASWITD